MASGIMPRLGAWAQRTWPDWFQRDPALKAIASEDGFGTTSGMSVNVHTAMNYSAVWAAVSVISKAIASLPCCVYTAQRDGSREKNTSAPAFWLLHEEPNPSTTPYTFFETLLHHVLVTGNGYAEITRTGSGSPAGLHLCDPFQVEPSRTPTGAVVYRDTKTGNLIPAKNMLHIPGLGWDGLKGYSVVQKARETIGLGLAGEQYGAAYFGNGTVLGLVFEHPKTLSQPAHDRLKKNLERQHQGSTHGWRPFVSEEGMTVKSVAFPNKDAEWLNGRMFQLEEIARWFDLPLTKLKSKAGERPGGNIEAQNIEFVVDCLRPRLVCIEQECNRKLIPMRERPNTYVEFNVDALLRGDSKQRADTYKVYVDMGVMSPDDVARKENLPSPEDRMAPLTERIESVGQLIRAGFDPEDAAKALGLPPMKHLGVLPVTVQPEDEPEPPTTEPGKEEEADEEAMRHAALRTLLMDGMDRLIRIEANEARRSPAKLDEFYPKHRARLESLLEPLLRLVSPLAQDSRVRAESLAEALCVEGRANVKDPLTLDRWEREGPAYAADLVLGRTA